MDLWCAISNYHMLDSGEQFGENAEVPVGLQYVSAECRRREPSSEAGLRRSDRAEHINGKDGIYAAALIEILAVTGKSFLPRSVLVNVPQNVGDPYGKEHDYVHTGEKA